MSYCRFSTEMRRRGKKVESDVYVFHSVPTEEFPLGSFECCACRIEEVHWVPKTGLRWHGRGQRRRAEFFVYKRKEIWVWGSFNTTSRSEMILHLLTHRLMGHNVPQHAITRLEYELERVGDHARYRGWRR